MWLLPMSLRAKMAAVVLLGIFFIPLATSDLRGLTHILTCQDEVSTSLYIDNDPEAIVLGSADTFTKGENELGLCGGLAANLQVLGVENNRADVQVSITNNTDDDWQGSMELHFDGTPVPISIGAIDSGATALDVVDVRIPEGTDYEVDGTLRIGL